ncbi:MAG: hypothetical protein K1X36_13775 [Pyrinomonadaceae bacterium]|nr:hypothetical protein [Pyrinomonadaceae bacterium]
MSNRSKTGTAATALIVCAAVFFRIWGLDRTCLWFDEIFSVHAAEHSWQTILSFISIDLIHPPVFYILLKLWIAIGGEGVVWMRLLPALFSCLSVFPFLMISRELKLSFWQRTTGLLIFAFNGSLIKYAQEVRMYSLLQFLSLLSIWLFVRYFIKGKSLVALVIVNLILVYSHYFGWFVVVCEVMAIAAVQRIKLRSIGIMFTVVLAGFAPWAIAVVRSVTAGADVGQNIGWMQKPGWIQILSLFTGLFEPFYYQASSAQAFTDIFVMVPIILLVLTVGSMVAINWKGNEAGFNGGSALMALFVVLPCLSAFAISWLSPYSIWGTRHLIVVFGPFALLLGMIIGNVRQIAIPAVFSLVFMTLAAAALVKQVKSEPVNYVWCAWEPLTIQAQKFSSVEPIFVFEDLVGYHAWFAVHNLQDRPRISKLGGIEGMVEDKAYFLPRGFDEITVTNATEVTAPAFWIMYREKTLDETRPPIRDLVARGFRVTDRKMMAAGTESALLIRFQK